MYRDRQAAGELLADKLANHKFERVALLALPRGGIVVAAPIALRLNIRLEVLVTRKIGHPANPEVAVGAVMPDGSAILNQGLIATSTVSREYLNKEITAEYAELKRRLLLYTGSEDAASVADQTAIVVDDGIATGYTVRAAIAWLKTLCAARIVLAVPVAPPEIIAELSAEVDEVLCPLQPPFFGAVGMFYQKFPQNTDSEVLAILADVNRHRP
ncbi:MAG: phosphoribosyltransferase family protein [Negativicutes bacterium]|nr:phosphoribosyltransferase family protein [Negativicutes bacterium]